MSPLCFVPKVAFLNYVTRAERRPVRGPAGL